MVETLKKPILVVVARRRVNVQLPKKKDSVMIIIDCKYGLRTITGLSVSSLAEAKKKRAELKANIRDCDRWYFVAKDEKGKKVLGSND